MSSIGLVLSKTLLMLRWITDHCFFYHIFCVKGFNFEYLFFKIFFSSPLRKFLNTQHENLTKRHMSDLSLEATGRGIQIDDYLIDYDLVGSYMGVRHQLGNGTKTLAAVANLFLILDWLITLSYITALYFYEKLASAVIGTACLVFIEIFTYIILTDRSDNKVTSVYSWPQRLRWVSFLLPLTDLKSFIKVCKTLFYESLLVYCWQSVLIARHVCFSCVLRFSLLVPLYLQQALLVFSLRPFVLSFHLLFIVLVMSLTYALRSLHSTSLPWINCFGLPQPLPSRVEIGVGMICMYYCYYLLIIFFKYYHI